MNTRVGGSSTSHHKATMGRVAASDLVCRDNARLFHTLRTQGNFDQLIWEFGDSNQPAWVHVSTRVLDQRPNRRLIFVAYKDRNNKTRYKRWTP